MLENLNFETASAEPSSYVIAAFNGVYSKPQHKKLTWDQLKANLSTFTPMEGEKRKDGRIKTPTSAPCFVGGRFHDETNAVEANLAARSLAVLDYDDCSDNLAMVEFALEMWGHVCFAYSTWSNTSDKAKFRVSVPLAYEVSADQYPHIVRALVDDIGLDGVDPASFKASQKMFDPAFEQGTTYDQWTFDVDGAIYQPSLNDIGDTSSQADDLEITIADVSAPLQIGNSKIEKALAALPAANLNYDEWLRVGMALRHEFQDDDTGFQLWDQWSQSDPRYQDASDLSKRWDGFAAGSENPVTLRSLMHMAKQNKPDWDMPEWAQGWVYNETLMEFHQIETQHSIKASAFNKKFNRMPDCVLLETPATNLVESKMRTVANKMYWPGMGEIMTHGGLDYVNTYRPHDVVPKAPDTFEAECAVEAVAQHARNLIPTEDEAELFLDFLAWVYQNPGKKVNWAVVLFGIEGNGKSFWLELMKRLLGHNAKEVSGENVTRQFTAWAADAQFIGVEEIRVPGEGKYTVLEKFKPLISNPSISIEAKGQDVRNVPNFASYLMLTNHRDALPLDDGSRRYCVIETWPNQKRDIPGKDYFDALFGALDNHIEAVAHYFAKRQVGDGFNPNGRAPETAGKAIMMEEAKTGPQLAMEEAIAALNSDVICDEVVYVGALREQAFSLDDDIEKHLPSPTNMGKVLSQMGYLKFTVGAGGKSPRIKGKIRTIYYHPDLIDAGEAEARVREHITGVPF